MTEIMTEEELNRVFADIRARRGDGYEPAPSTNGNESALPDLQINGKNLTETAKALRDLFAQSGAFFFNGNVPVRVVHEEGWPPVAKEVTAEVVIVAAHELCRPMRADGHGGFIPTTLPKSVAQLYLKGLEGEWSLPPFKGICCAPILSPDGSIRTAQGYDPSMALWCHNIPTVEVLDRPTIDDAKAALLLLRKTFKTFPFADATMIRAPQFGVDVVDLNLGAGLDESSYLACLMSGVCRASLDFVPGSLGTAADISGAGTGKGKLTRAICLIAHGISPAAITAGHNAEELEKRLTASLIEAAPAVFLDNVNREALRSNTLASVLTEDPAKVRDFGTLNNIPLNTKAWIGVTGNGLQVSEDLARRFIEWVLDAKVEDPEARPFTGNFLDDIANRRGELLAAVLTIWRWGRQNEEILTNGRPMGGFENWCKQVRDPLLTLGCRDPVERIAEVKANDPHRKEIAELYETWWEIHGDAQLKASELHLDVKILIDPKMSARRIERNLPVGTRIGGFNLERRKINKRATAIYRLVKTDGDRP
jgi:hypothetical protein